MNKSDRVVEYLKWDSDFFGYSVARLNLEDSDESVCVPNNYKLIYVFANSTIDALKDNLVDKKATYIRDLANTHTSVEFNPNIKVVSFNKDKHNFDQLLQLTLESGEYSRFAIDKNFVNNEYRKLYTKWIENSINKINAIEVLLAIEGESILGFVTLTKKDEKLADLGLLAVASAARGKKVATTLIHSAMKIAENKNFERLQVVTQLDNIPAVKLYQSIGFKLKELNYIYHIWNHDTI